MIQRKKIIIIASIVALALIPLFLAALTNSTPVENNQPVQLDDTNAPSLVIPESPLGIVSLVIACLVALSLFVISKRE